MENKKKGGKQYHLESGGGVDYMNSKFFAPAHGETSNRAAMQDRKVASNTGVLLAGGATSVRWVM